MSLGSSGPSPIHLSASPFWSEWSELWSTAFEIGLGSPAQRVRVVPTEGQTLNLTIPISRGCSGDLTEICSDTLFYPGQSTPWQPIGFEGFAPDNPTWVDLLQREDYQLGDYGYDSVHLGVDDEAPIVSNISIFGFTSWFLEMGRLGIRPFEVAADDVHTPSVLSQLRMDRLIPSLSWAYTPGSNLGDTMQSYIPGSLILGGFDANLSPIDQLGEAFEMANTPATAQTDDRSYLVVTVTAIIIRDNSTGGSQDSLAVYSTPFQACFSIGVTDSYLPSRARQMLDDNIFEVSSLSTGEPGEVSRALSAIADTSYVTIEFSSAGGFSAGSVEAPVQALFRNTSDGLNGTTRDGYYTISNSTEDGSSMATIGTTMLINAYLVANYERHTFSVSPLGPRAQSLQPDIRPILSTNASDFASESEPGEGPPINSTYVVVGGSLGAVVVPIIIATIIFFKTRRDASKKPKPADNGVDSSTAPSGLAVRGELSGESILLPLDGRERLEAQGDGCTHELSV